jgi:BirA family biotin operon repressor/biotin-[acetyl-CoA-carboxylase] ligase
MAIAAGLAVCDALDPQHRLGLAIKWPNDILAGGRKLGGILITTELTGAVVDSAIVGFGINLVPDAARTSSAMSIAELGTQSIVDATDLLPSVAEALEARYLALLAGDPDRALQTWPDRLAYLDQLVTVQDGPHGLTGSLLGIDSTGSLRLQTHIGEKLITSGDLTRGPKLI